MYAPYGAAVATRMRCWNPGGSPNHNANHRPGDDYTTLTSLLGGDRGQLIAARGAWETGDTLAVKVCSYETPFCSTVRSAFEGDEVRYLYTLNVGFRTLELPELVGRAVG